VTQFKGETGRKSFFSPLVFYDFSSLFFWLERATTVKTFENSHVSQFILSRPPFSLLPSFLLFRKFNLLSVFHFREARNVLNVQRGKRRFRVRRMIADFFYQTWLDSSSSSCCCYRRL
jgi:hypothetical protein